MPAVTIDASVVDGSNTKIHPNPAYPVQTPVAVPAELSGDLNAPSIITPNAITPEMPPFALNHARIMYDSILTNSSVASTSGLNPEFTLIPNTAQRWTFVNSSEITYTLPINTNIDTVCIGAHNLTGYSVTVQYDTTDGGAFTAITSSQSPLNKNSIMFHIDTAVSVKRLRIICNGTNASTFVGSVYAGIALQMQRPFFGGHTPAVLAKQADYYSSMSESGNFIGVEVRRRALESNADWKNLTDPWYRQYFVPFLDVAEGLPFYFAWNLLQYPTDVVYCKNITGIAPSYSGQRDLMTVGIPLVGIA